MKINQTVRIISGALLCGIIFSSFVSAQGPRKAKASATAAVSGSENKAPEKPAVNAVSSRVKQIDGEALKKVLTPNGKPLLVNFWATWCDPCREEFPDLVKLNTDYKEKLDIALISLDDLSEINREVPAFLTQMKAEMPAYLLKVADENAVISTVSKDWSGGLPFSVLYDASGKAVYTKMGKVDPKALRAEIEKSLAAPVSALSENRDNIIQTDYELGRAAAQKDISNGILVIRRAGLVSPEASVYSSLLKERYGIETRNDGCEFDSQKSSFDKGYNEISMTHLRTKFDDDFLEKVQADVNNISKERRQASLATQP